MSSDALPLIEAHVEALVELALSDEGELPDPPDLSGLEIAASDLARARELLGRLAVAEERLAGMRVRVRGEIEGMRRSRPDAPAPAPRVLDTTA